MIYGTPVFTIDDDQTDRIGIRVLVLSQMWQPSRWPMTIAELDEEAPAVPEVPGGLWFIGSQRRRQGGAMRTIWTFEGVNGDGKSVTFKTRGNSPDYSFEAGFAEESLLKSPRIGKLIEEFGGTVFDAEIVWPQMIAGNSGRSGLSGGSGGKMKPNPMYGHTTYLVQQGVYTYRYAALTLQGLTNGVNKIHKTGSLPGQPPSYSNRDWLKAPLVYQRRGPVFDVTETYWLSAEGGWVKPIYQAGETDNTGIGNVEDSGGLQPSGPGGGSI